MITVIKLYSPYPQDDTQHHWTGSHGPARSQPGSLHLCAGPGAAEEAHNQDPLRHDALALQTVQVRPHVTLTSHDAYYSGDKCETVGQVALKNGSGLILVNYEGKSRQHMILFCWNFGIVKSLGYIYSRSNFDCLCALINICLFYSIDQQNYYKKM